MDKQKEFSLHVQFGVQGSEESSSFSDVLTLFMVSKRNGQKVPLNQEKIYLSLKRACHGLESSVSVSLIMHEVVKNLHDNATTKQVEDALVLSAISYIEKDPAYSTVAARLLRQKISKEIFEVSVTEESYAYHYKKAFVESIKQQVRLDLLDARVLEFDLEFLASKLAIERDDNVEYLGLYNLYERYFGKIEERHIELPQMFWMRIAMGLSLLESNKNQYAVEFYENISKLLYMPGTPTLLHSGGTRPQLSSCFLTTITDDLHHIFKCMGDNAQMARWSGGIANDWTPLRATGAFIKSIRSGSQGTVPFLKIANDVNAAINRSGRRRGATVAYLETWHYDIEDFIDLRRNTGDERRRTHDMNIANWIPDLFMKRVMDEKQWTLFSPDEVPDLHDLYGKAFEKRYEEYEELAKQGKIQLFKTMPAVELWRKMLTRLFETGHPWMTFKDACNVRSPQDHVGVIHSSNLCTEITLNTSLEETAVCNLGSINLGRHVSDEGAIDYIELEKTIKTSMRMLDNVIDINFYPVKEGATSNKRHRPVGLGIMGFQDALFKMNISFSSPKALEFADKMGEFIAYHAILTSSELAKERGAYSTFKGSKWDKNLFPVDTIDLLEQERGINIPLSRTGYLDWAPVREHVKKYGMRNSNTMAVAPTATISNISGCYPCIEPIYKNLYVKANMGGEFTIINRYLVEDLKKVGMWNNDMVDLIKYYDGSIQKIDSIPQIIRQKYLEAFEIDALWLLELTAARGKWIDQSQSHNVFLNSVSGKVLDTVYKRAWQLGLKCTYYLRTLGASQIEKSSLDAKKFGFTQKREYDATIGVAVPTETYALAQSIKEEEVKACSLINTDCEACQ